MQKLVCCLWGLDRPQSLISSDLAYLLPPPEAHSSLWRASGPASLDSLRQAPFAAIFAFLVASEQDPLTRSAWRSPRTWWHSSACPPSPGLHNLLSPSRRSGLCWTPFRGQTSSHSEMALGQGTPRHSYALVASWQHAQHGATVTTPTPPEKDHLDSWMWGEKALSVC